MKSDGKTETLLLSSSFTRRFRNNFQGGVTYTRTLRQNDNTTGFGIQANNQFDLDADWARSTDFQRDTFRANGISTCRGRSTVGAVRIFYGSGTYYNATLSARPYSKPGTNRLNIGAPIVDSGGHARSVGRPGGHRHRHDVAAQRAAGTAAAQGRPARHQASSWSTTCSVELLAEVFNVFNWKNYGNYNYAARLAHIRAAGGGVGQRLYVRARASSGSGSSSSERPDHGDRSADAFESY